jgi:hypothetical protein
MKALQVVFSIPRAEIAVKCNQCKLEHVKNILVPDSHLQVRHSRTHNACVQSPSHAPALPCEGRWKRWQKRVLLHVVNAQLYAFETVLVVYTTRELQPFPAHT